jgi:hypothetical protein
MQATFGTGFVDMILPISETEKIHCISSKTLNYGDSKTDLEFTFCALASNHDHAIAVKFCWFVKEVLINGDWRFVNLKTNEAPFVSPLEK